MKKKKRKESNWYQSPNSLGIIGHELLELGGFKATIEGDSFSFLVGFWSDYPSLEVGDWVEEVKDSSKTLTALFHLILREANDLALQGKEFSQFYFF